MTTPTKTHDTSLKHDVEGALDPQWTDLAYEALSAGVMELAIESRDDVETVVLTGPCPRCGGTIRFHQVLTVVNTDTTGHEAGGQSATRNATATDGQSAPKTLVAYCTCDGAHEGRPTTLTNGCGIAFRIELGPA